MVARSLVRYGITLALSLPCTAFAETATGLQKLTLEQAILIAMEHNRDIHLSGLAVAGANAAGILASHRPQSDADATDCKHQSVGSIGAGGIRGKTVDSSVRLDQLIERGANAPSGWKMQQTWKRQHVTIWKMPTAAQAECPAGVLQRTRCEGKLAIAHQTERSMQAHSPLRRNAGKRATLRLPM